MAWSVPFGPLQRSLIRTTSRPSALLRWILATAALACTACGSNDASQMSAITAADAAANGDPDVDPPEPDSSDDVPGEAGTPEADDVVINPAVVYQTISGFGAADVFAASALTPEQAALFFDPENGIGLSILRIGIDINGEVLGSGVISDVQVAASYGAIVWATPWSPPPNYKDNDDEDNGGHLCATAGQGTCTTGDYEAWATTLASFPAWLASQTGVALYGLSPQNEPDYTATYASCLYTGSEMLNFIEVLGPMLANLNPPVKLIAPEPEAWADLWIGDPDCSQTNDYGPCIHSDPAADSLIAILATHDYAFQPVAPPSWVTQPIWETEVSGVQGSAQAGPSVDIANGIAVADWIYEALVTGGASAWHYWWLVSLGGTDNEGLLFPTGQGPDGGDINSPPKRLFAVGNFSKFVRPGYRRIDVSGPVPSGVNVAAFDDPTDETVVIVAINTNSDATSVPLFVSGANWPSQMTPWVTSAAANLATQPEVALTDGQLSVSLQPQSVTTFVGSVR